MTQWWSKDWGQSSHLGSPQSAAQSTACFSGEAFWESSNEAFRLLVTTKEQRVEVWLWKSMDLPTPRQLRSVLPTTGKEVPQALQHWSFDERAALPLQTVSVAKPWGEEVWHSGVESRGVCSIGFPPEQGGSMPLPLFELASGMASTEPNSCLPLVKELVPLDVPFYGELYTELHEVKSEVYVVSGLGIKSCPTGHGAVKLGLSGREGLTFAQRKKEIRENLLEFEKIRREVDQNLEQTGFDFSRVGPDRVSALVEAKASLSPELVTQEVQLYKQVSQFYTFHELSLGDVVRVPTHTPHALQPGVRVVEFQTPHYERKILSSNQKVLTQERWDVEEAVELLDVSAQDPQNWVDRKPASLSFARIRAVDFKDLQVDSLQWPKESSKEFADFPESQTARLLFILEGSLHCICEGIQTELRKGNCYLTPHLPFRLRPERSEPCSALVGSRALL